MRLRTYIFGAATGVLVAGVATWAVIGTANGNIGGAEVVTSTIHLANNPGQTFAPPPPGVSPALTAQQALDISTHKKGTKLAPDTKVQLGLYTRWVGPNCGRELRARQHRQSRQGVCVPEPLGLRVQHLLVPARVA